MTTRAAWWLPPVAWAAVLFWLSSKPGHELPMPSFFEADKVLHFGAFGLLALLLRQALVKSTAWSARAATMGAIALTAAYGFTDEVHQALGVAGRVADPFDWIADVAGALVAAPLHAHLSRPPTEPAA